MRANNDSNTDRIDGDDYRGKTYCLPSTTLRTASQPAAKAYGPSGKMLACERIDPGISSRYLELHIARDAIAGLFPEVTPL